MASVPASWSDRAGRVTDLTCPLSLTFEPVPSGNRAGKSQSNMSRYGLNAARPLTPAGDAAVHVHEGVLHSRVFLEHVPAAAGEPPTASQLARLHYQRTRQPRFQGGRLSSTTDAQPIPDTPV